MVDRVIFATGFENEVGELLGSSLEPIAGAVPGLAGTRLLAKRVPGKPVYVVGPAAGAGVVGRDETYSTQENVASLYAFRDRDVAVARDYLAAGPRAARTLDTSALDAPRRTPLGTGKASGPLRLNLPAGGRALTARTSLKGVLLKAEMADVLDAFRFPGATSIRVTVSAKGGERGRGRPQRGRREERRQGQGLARKRHHLHVSSGT